MALSETVKVVCTVEVEIPRKDLYPWDGTVTNEQYTKAISNNPSGNLLDFAQYKSLRISAVEVTGVEEQS